MHKSATVPEDYQKIYFGAFYKVYKYRFWTCSRLCNIKRLNYQSITRYLRYIVRATRMYICILMMKTTSISGLDWKFPIFSESLFYTVLYHLSRENRGNFFISAFFFCTSERVYLAISLRAQWQKIFREKRLALAFVNTAIINWIFSHGYFHGRTFWNFLYCREIARVFEAQQEQSSMMLLARVGIMHSARVIAKLTAWNGFREPNWR